MYLNVCTANVGPKHLKYLTDRKMFRLKVVEKHTSRFIGITVSAYVLQFWRQT